MSQNRILAARLAAARKENNYTQEEMAEFLGCGRATITNYENGRRSPDYETLTKLAKKYNVTTDYLLGLTKAETTDKDIRYICDYTGLSVSAVDKLNRIATEAKQGYLEGCDFKGELIINFNKSYSTETLKLLSLMLSIDSEYSLTTVVERVQNYLTEPLIDFNDFGDMTENEYKEYILFRIQQDFLKMVEYIKNEYYLSEG